MEEARELLKEGVLSHLSLLEMQSLRLAKQQTEALREQGRLQELRAKVEKLRARRDELRAKVSTTTCTEQLAALLGQDTEEQTEELGCSERARLELSVLAARLTRVKHLLRAHHLIGGYDIVETHKGKRVCFSIATAFEGQYLDRYNLELDMAHTLRICRHNIPPFVPLERLAQDSLQTDLRAFLNALSWHLNAFAGRRQQVCLIKERLQGSVEVMESNTVHSLLVLMCQETGERSKEVLLTLEYCDPMHHLPTRVAIESQEKNVLESEEWSRVQQQLEGSPVHTVLLALKKQGRIR